MTRPALQSRISYYITGHVRLPCWPAYSAARGNAVSPGGALGVYGATLPEVIEYFQEADLSALMRPREFTTFQNTPAEIKLYRGARLKPEGLPATACGLSWTSTVESALWFALTGYGTGPGVVMSVTVPKSAVLALFIGDVIEYVIDPRTLLDVVRIERETPVWPAHTQPSAA